MQLGRRCDYAVRVVLELARQAPGTITKTGDLGRRTGVPTAYPSKVVQNLARAGLVRTRRGALGGVALRLPPRAITLRQIVEAVEGPIAPGCCVARPGLCPRERTCPVRPVWLRIQAMIRRELDAVRLEDLAARSGSAGR